jgi:hypothetical protein
MSVVVAAQHDRRKGGLPVGKEDEDTMGEDVSLLT